MDNNTNNQNNMPFVQPGQPQMQPGMQPQYGQPQMQYNQQPQYGQPQMQPGMQPQYGQPQMQPGMQPQYGQPQMQPGMQPQYGQPQMQPGMQPQGKVKKQKAPKVKKPLSNGKIAAIIGGSVALVAAIVLGIIFIPKLFKPAKDVVVDAFENTFTTSANKEEKENYMQQVIGYDDIYDVLFETGGEQLLEVSLNSVNGEEVPYALSFGTDTKLDYINKLVNASVNFDIENKNVLDINLIGDENYTYLEVPNVIDGYFSLPNDNIFVELENSPLGSELDLYGMPEFDLDYFGTDSTTELNSGYVTALETLWDSVEVEKEGKAKVDVNGKTVKATEYVVTIGKKDLQDALTAIVNATLTDEYIVEYAEMSGMAVEDVEATFESVKAMIPTIINKDLVAKVYVKDDKVVKITSEMETNIYGVTLGCDFFFDIDEEDVSGELAIEVMGETVAISFNVTDMKNAPKGSVILDVAGEEIEVNFAFLSDVSDTDDATNVDISVNYNSEEVATANFAMNVDKTSNAFDGKISLFISEDYIDMGEIEIAFEGEFKDINKGVSYTQVFDSIECFVDGASIVDLSAVYTLNTGDVSVSDVDSGKTVYDLTVMTAEDIETVIYNNGDAIIQWLDDIIANTGSFGEDLSDMIFGYGYDDDYDYDDYDYDTPSLDEAILTGYNASIQIYQTVEGFLLDNVSFYIDFSTSEYSTLTYYMYEDYTVEEVLELAYMPSEEAGDTIYDSAMNQEITISDGSTVYYSYVQYDSFGFTMSSYTMAKEVAPGVILNVDATIYDEYDSYTLEDIAEALNENNYAVITN